MTQDITSKATWKTDVPQLVTVSAAGIVSPTGNGCGVADISASASQNGNLVIGYATVTINDPTDPLCPGNKAQAVLSVQITSGSGTVTSSPTGISCPGQCIASFSTGTPVVLNATPTNGATSVTWTSGCTSSTGNQCSVTMSADTSVTATFQ